MTVPYSESCQWHSLWRSRYLKLQSQHFGNMRLIARGQVARIGA